MSTMAPDPKQLKRALFAAVDAEVRSYGFTLRAPRDRFIRSRDGVTDMFQLVMLDGKPGWRIQPNVGVRIERVEDIFHRTSGFEPKYQKDTPTIGSSVGAITAGDNRACEFLVESESGILPASEKIVRIFKDMALPYFDKFGSIYAIDAELNTHPTKETRHRAVPWSRCSTGSIVAKLTGRRDYEKLIVVYTDVMRNSDKGFYLGVFQELLKSLETVDAETVRPKEQ